MIDELSDCRTAGKTFPAVRRFGHGHVRPVVSTIQPAINSARSSSFAQSRLSCLARCAGWHDVLERLMSRQSPDSGRRTTSRAGRVKCRAVCVSELRFRVASFWSIGVAHGESPRSGRRMAPDRCKIRKHRGFFPRQPQCAIGCGLAVLLLTIYKNTFKIFRIIINCVEVGGVLGSPIHLL